MRQAYKYRFIVEGAGACFLEAPLGAPLRNRVSNGATLNRPGFHDCSGYWVTVLQGGVCLTVVESLELCRRHVAVVVGDLAVKTPVVEPVDVAEGGELDVVEAMPRTLG